MDSNNYDKLMQDIASFYYDTCGVEWHYEEDFVDLGDDGNGDGYQGYETKVIELDDVTRIFADGEHQSNFEDHLISIIKEVEDEN